MAFPFFRNKNQPPATSKASRSVAPSVKPTAPPAAEESRAPAPPPELPDLDFVSGSAADTVRSSDGSIELHVGSSRVHPAVEEAAMLYANGHAAHAMQSLEALLGEDLGSDTEQVWSLLFDLYQVLGKREAFDRLALDYVVRFERSPPTWSAAAEAVADAAGGVPVCNLSGALSAGSAKQFEQMQRLLAKAGAITLDVAKVKNADTDGCALFVDLLALARKQRRVVSVLNPSVMADVLAGKLVVGKRENQTMWLLLLELLQQQGDQEGFEEWALNYAITFEVSPPSWEEPKPLPASPAAGASAAAGEAGAEAYLLRGELCGASNPLFLELEAHAQASEAPLLDLAGVRRMDFVFAGMLLNTLSALARRGKHVRLVNGSPLVCALLNVVGVGQVAEIVRRRA